jgi:hypothetical protein
MRSARNEPSLRTSRQSAFTKRHVPLNSMVIAWIPITKELVQTECLLFVLQALLQTKTVVFVVKTGAKIRNVL